jgi:hypothetical protein
MAASSTQGATYALPETHKQVRRLAPLRIARRSV